MPRKTFEYKEKESGIFGKVKRPLISIEIRGKDRRWVKFREILADTGADISILPRDIGELLVTDIADGDTIEIRGVVPYAKLVAFIHHLTFRFNGKKFRAPVAIADSNDVPPILGRVNGLDIFDVNFSKGRKINFAW